MPVLWWAMSMLPSGWQTCWPSAATWTDSAPALTPATSLPPRGWLICWPNAATRTPCAPAPTPATAMLPGGWPAYWPERGELDGLHARADVGDRYAASWLADLLANVVTWTPCAFAPTPATSTLPCDWQTS